VAEGPQRPTSGKPKQRGPGDAKLDGRNINHAQASEGAPRHQVNLPSPFKQPPPKTANLPEPYQNAPVEKSKTMGSSSSSKGILKKQSTRQITKQASSTSKKPSNVHMSIKAFLDAEESNSDASGDAQQHIQKEHLRGKAGIIG
jgi:hypothetical protein